MESTPSSIPVVPPPFAHGLVHFSQALARGQAKIVAIGSSTTAGEGNIVSYPDRLLPLLRAQYPAAAISLDNRGVGGQEAPVELLRFDADVISRHPDLVIWQVGTNAVWQDPGQVPPPPTFFETTKAIQDGLVRLHNKTEADIILMDLQYVPTLLTPDKAIAMVVAIGELARDAGVNAFRRFAFMKALHEIEGVSFDKMVDPTDDKRLHDSDWVTQRLAWALKLVIAAGADIA
ncbi:lysophospholipase [Bradyrhizobium nanningense]|uniref:Lysophospholipase n=1 Tax=Bradyrhizobium nanningense TaxID=1325118 RepID=A0A4V1L1B3_9BRAD|nr:SGNH/GDSL hydrolase family protein [Bradyrhizobium nanningense]RXH24050.1 lysophospholipase [Bradyrhizobium nanningense]